MKCTFRYCDLNAMQHMKKSQGDFSFSGYFLSTQYGPDLLHWGYNLKQLSGSGSGSGAEGIFSDKRITELF